MCSYICIQIHTHTHIFDKTKRTIEWVWIMPEKFLESNTKTIEGA